MAVLLWVLLVAGVTPSSFAQPSGTSFSGPLVITKGGTYSGNWESQDSNTPAVSINTSEPVIIENSIIRSRTILIRAHQFGNDVTVRNTSGYALTPNGDNIRQGRFLDAGNFKNIRVEHCYMEQTSGIYLADYQGDHSPNQTVKILYNQAKNIDGSYRNGGQERVQFAQFVSVKGIRGVEIGWNQVINDPFNSRVEENINMYHSSGTSDSPMQFHNNFIQGAYPSNPASNTDYGGGGIMMGDGATPDLGESSGFIKAFNNQILSTANQGICVAAGHDMEIFNNRIIASGYMPNGEYVAAQGVGIYILNGSRMSTFFNNRAHDNIIGYVNRRTNGAKMRNDQYLPDAAEPSRYDLNTELPNPITRDTEANEFALWQKKLKDNNIAVGPTNGTGTQTSAPAPTLANLRPADNPSNVVNGLAYSYHEGTWSGLPDFNGQAIVKQGTVSTFDLSPRNRNDNFGFRYTGYIEVPTDGEYTFYTSSDDGSQLFIGDQLVVDNNGVHANQERGAAIGLKAGKHALTVTFFERDGGETLVVKYQGPGVDKQVVPASALFRSATATQTPNTISTPSSSTNLVVNPGFESNNAAVQSPNNWQTWGGRTGTNSDADYTETVGGTHSGTYHGSQYKTSAYEVYTYQTISNLPNGTYTLRAWTKSSGGQFARMLAKNYGGNELQATPPVTTANGINGSWSQIEIRDIQVTNGRCEIGFYSYANAGQWFFFDDVEFVSQGSSLVSASASAAFSTLADAKASTATPTGVQLYPNPAQDHVNISSSFAQAGQATVTISNTQGKQVAQFSQSVQAGTNQFSVPTQSLSAGVYVLQVQSGKQVSSQRLTITH
ncbi:PA14 domain-containing protein [Hymenobacter sp. BT491]|uniref:PA14 domain-containing protein n=1 Tax=Hymenobacter sp. BT491 TaxID=2766779 RepID=UPI0016535594|nr:PA14 domain-containing protein [Hymenobacter sp. BT491]MBC6989193.1 T9SS type A sorting domain-containing protein [Hymenobacter sp. BT491]